MSYDFSSAMQRGEVAERITHNILVRGGWHGATNVRNVARQRRSYDHLCDLPGQPDVRIDSKIRERRYPDILFETRHVHDDGHEVPGWGTKGETDLLFYYLPEPLSVHVIDVAKMAALVNLKGYKEWRNPYPTKHNSRSWFTFHCLVPLKDLGAALLDTFEIADVPHREAV